MHEPTRNPSTSQPGPRPAAPVSRGHRRLLLLPALALAVACGVGLSVRGATGTAGPGREITLVARDMAFYLPDDPTPNPRLVLMQGERVALTLRNDDPGMAHDFAVEGPGPLDRASKLIESGESDRIEFTVPATVGEFDYLCSIHPRMMRGIVEVR